MQATGSRGRQRRRFDEVYKRQAVALAFGGERSVQAVAAELGVARPMLYQWRRVCAPWMGGAPPGARALAEAEAENQRLRAEIGRLKQRELALKQSLGILCEPRRSGMPRSKP